MISKLFEYIKILVTNNHKRALIYQKKGVRMGTNCQVFYKSSFGSEPYLIQLGDNVKITYGCQFITHDGGVEVLRNLYSNMKNADVFGKITIGNNVFIGNKCIIMPNVTIGDNVIIGAGSIVTKNFPSNVVIAGVPAKIIKSLEEYKLGVEKKVEYTKNMTYKEKRDYLIKKINTESVNQINS